MEIIQGTLAKIYKQFTSGYLIAIIEPGGEKVVGTLSEPVLGDKMEFYGEWVDHSKYGLQFRFDSAVKYIPKDKQEMLEFLSMLKNIGPVRAQEIIKTFGDSIFTILDAEPQRLTAISGISTARAQEIANSWNRLKADKDNIFFLNDLGCTPSQRQAILNHYKEKTIELMQENPYRLIKDIAGFGFKTVDELAKKLGFGNDSIVRAEAAVEHIFQEAAATGQHTYLPGKDILKAGQELQIPKNVLKTAINNLTENKTVVPNTREKWCALRSFYEKEKYIAEKIRTLLSHENKNNVSDDVIDKEIENNVFLNDKQLEAVEIACHNNVAIITGLPGTGKTTLLKTLLSIYKGKRIALASPTGKAAKRMSEATGLPAGTVHRLLEYNPERDEFERGEGYPLDADLVVIDESSMLDTWLTFHLLKAIAPGTKLLLVGDADQLPSVGPGNVLADLLSTKNIPSIKLTQIMRQSEASVIIKNAHRINKGLPLELDSEKDFFFIEEDEPDFIITTIKKLVSRVIPERFRLDPIKDIQVLCPQNVGAIGSIIFNKKLQSALNPASDGKAAIKIGTEESFYYLRTGDRVIQTVNNYELGVFNGTCGIIKDVDSYDKTVWVDFGGESDNVEYKAEDLIQLKLSYAISVHKSQGSEFPCVVIPIHICNKYMLMRNLLYTAVTRGKQYVYIVGTESAINYAIKNDKPTQRYTLLRRFLAAGE